MNACTQYMCNLAGRGLQRRQATTPRILLHGLFPLFQGSWGPTVSTGFLLHSSEGDIPAPPEVPLFPTFNGNIQIFLALVAQLFAGQVGAEMETPYPWSPPPTSGWEGHTAGGKLQPGSECSLVTVVIWQLAGMASNDHLPFSLGAWRSNQTRRS